jgi:hypothetical protein
VLLLVTYWTSVWQRFHPDHAQVRSHVSPTLHHEAASHIAELNLGPTDG